ncbi:MAG: fascin domain-containing protein [Alphaproteobacteria bacterium]
MRRRLLTVATSDQVGFTAGDTTAFQSLRDIRKAQQEKRDAGRIAMARANPYYCKPSRRKGNPGLESQLAGPGVCICSYGRRYAASNPALSNSPVRVAYRQCGPTGRFRVHDLNGGRLRHGDWITLQTAHDAYVSMNRDGYVYGNRRSPGKGEKFRVIRATNLPGVIRSGEMITLVSALGAFVVPDLKKGRLRATKTKPEAHEFIVLMPN